MTHLFLAVILALTSLPPEAARHGERAAAHYDAGRLDAAIDEFAAAYAALPDPRNDRADREQMLGSLHGLLLQVHATDGAPEPLCRLQELLRAHVAALRTAQGEGPAWPELTLNQARLDRVSGQLAQIPGAPCERAPTGPAANAAPASPHATPGSPANPAPASPHATPGSPGDATTDAVTPTPAGTTAPPPPVDAPDRGGRRLRIAGGVVLGLSAGLVGIMGYGIAREQRLSRDADALDRGVDHGQISPEEYARLLDYRAGARTNLGIAIGTGAAALVGAAIGVTLLALARRARARRVALAPWWLHTGAGLTVALPLP